MQFLFNIFFIIGIDPNSWAGSNTGVFLGHCFDEYMAAYSDTGNNIPLYRQCYFAMLHNVFDFKGPAKHFDTACASGFSAFHQAIASLRAGECDQAIVVGLNICLRAGTQHQFLNLNMLSPEGKCKCLDDDANGYAKGEACVAVVLQHKSQARRIYARIIHSKTNCDGFKDLGITFPSFELQAEVISDAFKEAQIDPLEVEYCEAHCTGTQAGDPSEMRAIYDSMCVGRTKPLKIGALKSVIGHTEGASGLCGLVKSILCFENELIPPNLHMTKINHNIDGLVKGILEPVTECTPFKGRMIAMNCFGFGGVNVHAIIEKNAKEISDNEYQFGTLPRLVIFCGRNQESLENMHQFLIDNPDKITTGFLALLDNVAKTSPYPNRMFGGMIYRGARLFKPDDCGRLKPLDEVRFNQVKSETKPSVCFVFTGMGCQWPMMGRELYRIDSMSRILQQCSEVLKRINSSFNLMNILTSDDPKILQSPTNSFVAIAAIQMAIVEFLRQLEIEPDFVIGHSIGELSCAYADQCLTLEETITAAYIRGQCMAKMAEQKQGKMAAIGCTWEQATQYCQQYSEGGKVWPACHNSFDSVTVAGSKLDMDNFISKLQQQEPDLFVRAINSSNVAFHCPYIEEMRDTLRQALNENICFKQQKSISSKWLTTTYEQKSQEFNLEYLVDNLLEPVRFYEVFQRLPSNVIFVEIAPNNLLQAVIKRNIFERNKDSKYVATMTRKSGQNNVDILLTNIGQLYVNGLNPWIEKLYPSYEYPVARTTQSLHSMIRWKHDRHFKCTKYPEFFNHDQRKKTYKSVDMQNADDKFFADHCVDGRILFPATGYLYFAWELASRSMNSKREETPIIFEDVIIHRATIMPKSGLMSFAMKFNKENGMFVMLNDGTVTTTGRIRIPNKQSKFLLYQDMLNSVDSVKTKKCRMQLAMKDVYKEFRLRGYDYGPEFQSINEVSVNDEFSVATVTFKNWVTFVDGMIQTVIIGRPIRALLVPVRIDYLACDPIMMSQKFKTISENATPTGETTPLLCLDTIYDFCLNIATSSGIEFRGIKANLAPRRIHPIVPSESMYEFVPHNQHDLLLTTSRSNSYEYRLFLTEQLLQYQDLCARYLQDHSIDESFNMEQFETKVATPILMNILKQIDFDNFEQQQLDTIENDLLFHSYLNEVFIRPQLETVVENFWEPLIEILEVGQTRNLMASDILKWVAMDTFRVNFNCRLLHPSPTTVNPDHLNSIYSQHEWLAEKSKFPTELINIDLIVYKDSSICPLVSKHEIDLSLMLESLWNCLKDNGFAIILIRDRPFPVERYLMDKLNMKISNESRVEQVMTALGKTSFKLLGERSDRMGVHSFLIRKISIEIIPENQIYINFTNNVKDWFELLQNSLKEIKNSQIVEQKFVWLIANDYNSGVLGFTNCLRKEPDGLRIRCIYNGQSNCSIDVESEMVKNIVKLNLQMNAIGPDGSFGSFKHFSLSSEDTELIPVEHCFLNAHTRGDLSSLRWFEAQHKHWPANRKPTENFFTVYFASLNFRDIMLATGKLPPDALPLEIGLDDCLLGIEFAGRDENGNRVMGMKQSKSLATTLVYDDASCLTWPIPDKWTMEEAVTIPVAYGTAYYALLIRGNLREKEKVLIHSGSGAVGQAAIAICLSYNCHLFITVGSEEKRTFLMEKFPHLKPNQFASSRDTAFEKMILQATDGKGVDVVLNSLAEDKLFASVNCLAPYGRFLEIGKFDLSQNSKLSKFLL